MSQNRKRAISFDGDSQDGNHKVSSMVMYGRSAVGIHVLNWFVYLCTYCWNYNNKWVTRSALTHAYIHDCIESYCVCFKATKTNKTKEVR